MSDDIGKTYELRLDIECELTGTGDLSRPDAQAFLLAEGTCEYVNGIYAEVQAKFKVCDWQAGPKLYTVFMIFTDTEETEVEEWDLGFYTKIRDARKLVRKIKKFVDQMQTKFASENP